MEKLFASSFEYKLIYILEIRNETHKGLLKIGDTSLQTDESIDNLPPNCRALNQAAKARIKEYTNTAGISFELLHTELAIRTVKDKEGEPTLKAFRDHHVHRLLENSGIRKKKLNNSTSREWFELDIKTALKAINAVKKGQYNLSNISLDSFTPIIFRPEQEIAIKNTLKQFKTGNRMLWNAKMRFGKTLCALEVIRQSKFSKTIIITHRPVVDSGWYEDFGKIFHGMPDYIYGSKSTGYTIEQLLETDKKIVFFASMQDLRGSDAVGGKFDKNNAVFDTSWDLVIVDEAHEGTTTALGNDVIKSIVKEEYGSNNTKFLALSGTPFNILGDYDENIYTWDYVMEQSSKYEWDQLNFGDSNPYDELPELKIFTYDLGQLIADRRYVEIEDKAFNFREFFRVWAGDVKIDRKPIPVGVNSGDFFHEKDVRSFLDLITKENKHSRYPYSTHEYRSLFRHSLWMVPGVKEARALSKMLRTHPIFGNGVFDIVNVAGDGDEEEKSEDALKRVRDAIDNAGEDGYTITLSCGKLTTGVTVPEWTAVFMLSGSFSTSAANYLQTIFRVQSPCNKDGKIKRSCYVFDFAPDRTLKMVAESVAISTKAGKTDDSDRRIMGEFLNYCPVIAVDGTSMKKYDTNRLLQQLKRAYADRAVKNGFDDNNLYNDELLKLDDIDLDKFKKLKGIVGTSKAAPKSNNIDINQQGFTEEEYEEIKRLKRKPKRERTPEEEEKLNKIAENNKQAANARSILRGISIRMPLLIYGADINIDEDITMEKLVDIVDDSSWEEFMPTGVTKEIFKGFIKYYDPEIFVVAGRKIRNTVKGADELSPTDRVLQIAQLFSNFKNPDKETVLTPWRVVNMHMGDCLGGYNFYDTRHNELIEEPRYVDNGKVTADTLGNKKSKILEINSKTGLYPLYITYSIFRSRCNAYLKDELTVELEEKLWAKTVQQNIFVICKTPMAKAITTRTLTGFKEIPLNARYFDDLTNMMRNKSKQFVDRILRPSYWRLGGVNKMKFDAVVGNPPYQMNDGGGRGNSATPLYNKFIEQAKKISPRYLSMITPARWYSGGKGLDGFRYDMLNDQSIQLLVDYFDSTFCFPGVDISGGICYFLWDRDYQGECSVRTYRNGKTSEMIRPLLEKNSDTFIRFNEAIPIIRKIQDKSEESFENIVSVRRPFGIDAKVKTNEKKFNDSILMYSYPKDGFISSNEVKTNKSAVDKYKVFIAKAYGERGDFPYLVIGKPFIGNPGTCCSETYLLVGAYDRIEEAQNVVSYMRTRLFRFLVLFKKNTQNAAKGVYKYVPIQDFSKTWTDKELYEKYNINESEVAFIESLIRPGD